MSKKWATTAWNSPAGATISKWTAPSPNPITCKKKWALLAKHGLACHAISNHLVGQAVCDLIDERHRPSCPPMSGATANPKASASAPPKK